MEDKLNQPGAHPASGTGPAPNDPSTEAPTEVVAEGEHAASAENQVPRSAQVSTPEDADAHLTQDAAPSAQQASAAPETDAEAAQDAPTPPSESKGGFFSSVVADVADMAIEGLAAAFGGSRAASSSQEPIQEEPRASAAETGETPHEAVAAPDASEAQTTPETSAAPQDPEPEAEPMTMEEVMAASDEQLARKPIHRGMLTTGTVIMLSQEGIVLDVGQKVEGMVPYNQLFEFEADAAEAAKYFKPGDEMQVYAIRVDIPNSTIILSKKRADQERAWNLLQDIYDKSLPVEVEIVEKVRGGLVANLGVRAFLPASQVDVRRINDLSPYVGKRMKVRIIELNRRRNRVIISRRSIVEEEIAGLKEETLKKLEPGAKLEGEVVEITDFGAFVNLGGVDGLVHRSEITHGRFNHPRDVLELGQHVKVEVLDMDLERERINLSMKSLRGDPWEEVLANYTIGQRVAGKVTNLTPFGAFVEIESGLEGLIHVSEMSWTKRVRHPKEIVEEGQDVEAMILKIDVPQQRISLGLRQTQPDPWSSLPDRYPPGTEVTGPITGLTDFGVFMEIEEGIEGLVHISELAHEHIDNISEHFNKGDEITAVILNIDPIEQRASLSRRRTLPFSAGDEEASLTGAPQSRSGGRKGGRRGGRRSQGIDYDYSYASSDTGSKTTTKLGDVYADLFAQFGLGDTQSTSSAQDSEPKASTTEPDERAVAQTAPDEAVSESQAETSQPEAQAAARAESDPESAGSALHDETSAAESSQKLAETSEAPPEDDENAIDAAEAAALLTAAFRQGRRPAMTPPPVSEHVETEEEKEATDA